MSQIRVLLTAVGCPGASTLIRYFKKNTDLYIVGVDSSADSIGKFLADEFFVVPQSDDPSYIEELKKIAVSNYCDCIIPSSSYEVEHVALNKSRFEKNGIKVLASPYKSLQIANNKKNLYNSFIDDPMVSLPEFYVVQSWNEFESAYKTIRAAGKEVCFKPPFSKGSRGFRYLTEKVSLDDLLYKKPDGKSMSFDSAAKILSNAVSFPELLVMERVYGEAIDSMAIGKDGECLLVTHKSREKERDGIITFGCQVDRPALTKSAKRIVEKLGLEYNIGVQFIGGNLIEINPRLSTFMYTPTWNEPHIAIKLALGELSKDDVKSMKDKIPYGIKMIRYFDQVFYY